MGSMAGVGVFLYRVIPKVVWALGSQGNPWGHPVGLSVGGTQASGFLRLPKWFQYVADLVKALFNGVLLLNM